MLLFKFKTAEQKEAKKMMDAISEKYSSSSKSFCRRSHYLMIKTDFLNAKIKNLSKMVFDMEHSDVDNRSRYQEAINTYIRENPKLAEHMDLEPISYSKQVNDYIKYKDLSSVYLQN